MLEIGIFHNGASDLPCTRTKDGVVVNDGNLAEVHESNQRVLVNQIRQGILADRLGFNYFFMTEHHFQPEGAEFSPNPLISPGSSSILLAASRSSSHVSGGRFGSSPARLNKSML